jgi:hypothetical protein
VRLHHKLRIKDPCVLFKLALEHSPLQYLEGVDEDNVVRCTFNFAQRVVIMRYGDGLVRFRMHEFVKPEHLFEHAFLLTLSWRSPGGWSANSPLELLALSADWESTE